MIPDLWSSRGESTTSKIGFYPGILLTYYFIIQSELPLDGLLQQSVRRL